MGSNLSAAYAWITLFPSVSDGPFLGIGPNELPEPDPHLADPLGANPRMNSASGHSGLALDLSHQTMRDQVLQLSNSTTFVVKASGAG
jgi:hypothetical protein